MRFLSKILILSIGITTSSALASGGEEGGGAAAAAPSNRPDPNAKKQKEFNDKTSKLNALTTRIADSEKEFHHLVKEKAAATTPEAKKELMDKMLELVKGRNKAAEEFNKIKSELTYRYANQGELLNRRYHTQQKKTVEELEGAAGLDEMLSSVKKAIDRKYAPFNPPKPVKTVTPGTKEPEPTESHGSHAKTVSEDEEKPKRLRLEK